MISRDKGDKLIKQFGFNLTNNNNLFAVTGKTKADRLQDIKLAVFNNEKCVLAYKVQGATLSNESQLCVGGEKWHDSCVGDSGSALMISTSIPGQLVKVWKLVGIVSFGPQTCGMQNVPGVYSRVRYYIDWIMKTVKEFE